ncbi:MAG: hypothetical protein PVJ49_02005 [Acidobacteriota bacterium]|jgi:hypothetical protein
MSVWIEGRRSRGAAVLVVLLATVACQAFSPGFAEFGGERTRSLRDRAAQQDAMLELRLELLLPSLMDAAGIDCWLVVSDGVSSDPVVSALTVAASRLEGMGALLLCRNGAGLSRFALGRGLDANAGIYEVAEPADGMALEDLINDRLRTLQPQRIAIDDAFSFAPADGLSASDARWLRERLDPEFADRLISARPLVEDFLSTQLDVEAPLLAESTRLTAAILEEVLSDRVVVAAGTSLADLDWAVRSRVAAIDAELAYPPYAFVYRPGSTLEAEHAMGMDVIVQPGDLVFLSAGIGYMGYANRLGRWAYLLPSGTRQAPEWVDEALAGLADGAAAATTALAVGQDDAQAHGSALTALTGMADPRVVLDRVTRLRAGSLDPWRPAAVFDTWRPDYRLAGDTGLVITVHATVAPPPPPGAAPQPFVMLTIDTALLTSTGGRLVVPAQRTPLLID